MNKKITKKGYRILAIVWTLAAASMAVAVVRRLPELSVMTLCLLAASVIAARGFWKSYRRTPEVAGGPAPFAGLDPFDGPPKFSGRSALFDDDPNQDSEEKKHG